MGARFEALDALVLTVPLVLHCIFLPSQLCYRNDVRRLLGVSLANFKVCSELLKVTQISGIVLSLTRYDVQSRYFSLDFCSKV